MRGLTTLAVLLMFAKPAGAACQFVVDAGGGGTHTTIQAAVDALPLSGPCRIDVRPGTYRESVEIAGRNAAAIDDGSRILIVGRGGAILAASAAHAMAIRRTRFVTIEGLTIAGASDGAVLVEASQDVTIARNDIHNNGAGPRGGGIFVGPESDRVFIVNNLIRSNGRNGVEIAGPSGSAYVVNNTILSNGWNGIRSVRDRATYIVNNLVVGNGTDGGTTGGRWGFTTGGEPQYGPAALVNNVFYRNGARAGTLGGDIDDAGPDLDATRSDNVTTSGTAGAGVSGCAIAGCVGAPFSVFFPGTGFGPDFHLTVGSPASGRGRGSFMHDGRELVPDVDFDGEPRDRRARVDAGCLSAPSALGK